LKKWKVAGRIANLPGQVGRVPRDREERHEPQPIVDRLSAVIGLCETDTELMAESEEV
jgi:hypothetical protein